MGHLNLFSYFLIWESGIADMEKQSCQYWKVALPIWKVTLPIWKSGLGDI